MKIPVKNIWSGVLLCVAPWLYAVFNPGIHENAFAVLVFWWVMGATAIIYSLWKMEYSPGQRYQATGLRLGLFGFTMVCLGGLLGQAADMETVASIIFMAGLGPAGLGIVALCFGLIKKEHPQGLPVSGPSKNLTIHKNNPPKQNVPVSRPSKKNNYSGKRPAQTIYPSTHSPLKKAFIIIAIGTLIIVLAYLIFAGGDKYVGLFYYVILPGTFIACITCIIPNWEGITHQGFRLIAMGILMVIASAFISKLAPTEVGSSLFEALTHNKAGTPLFMMGWFLVAMGMAIAVWYNENFASQRWSRVGFKIIAMGLAVFAVGGVFELLNKEISSILVNTGHYIMLAGMLVHGLGIIEDQMR